MLEAAGDAAVMIILGQSNAHGHELPMQEEDKIKKPLANVFGLGRKDNQHLDLTEVVWSGYQSAGMNLGESQDHTYCIATELARTWQAHLDAGNQGKLPDLYIIQISIGAQALSNVLGETRNMWNLYRPAKLVPGPLGTVDISLYPFTLTVLEKAMQDLHRRKKNPQVLGVHWSAGNDCGLPEDKNIELADLYTRLFAGFREKIGQECVIYLERLLCKNRLKDLGLPENGLDFENAFYDQLVKASPLFKIISAADSPYWEGNTLTNGIYIEDYVHYTADVQKWFASQYFQLAGKLFAG